MTIYPSYQGVRIPSPDVGLRVGARVPDTASGTHRDSSANWGQIIPDYLFYPSIIGHYWRILAIIAIIFAKSFAIICYYCTRAQNINYCNYSKKLLQLFIYAIHYLHYCN